MKAGDLVLWRHEYTKEDQILYVVEVLDDEYIKCLFPYGAYQTMKKARVKIYNMYKKP